MQDSTISMRYDTICTQYDKYLTYYYYRVLRDGDIVNVDVSVYYKVPNMF